MVFCGHVQLQSLHERKMSQSRICKLAVGKGGGWGWWEVEGSTLRHPRWVSKTWIVPFSIPQVLMVIVCYSYMMCYDASLY